MIEAFNNDMPYDQFVTRQLAADLTGDERRHLAALGFLTVGINLPRPTDVPENLEDRIDVVTRGFLGLSVACARCHDHKYDPIPQKDYYSIYSVFLNSPDVLEPALIERMPETEPARFFSRETTVAPRVARQVSTRALEPAHDRVSESRRAATLHSDRLAGTQPVEPAVGIVGGKRRTSTSTCWTAGASF